MQGGFCVAFCWGLVRLFLRCVRWNHDRLLVALATFGRPKIPQTLESQFVIRFYFRQSQKELVLLQRGLVEAF